jgi:hypothetical protein
MRKEIGLLSLLAFQGARHLRIPDCQPVHSRTLSPRDWRKRTLWCTSQKGNVNALASRSKLISRRELLQRPAATRPHGGVFHPM